MKNYSKVQRGDRISKDEDSEKTTGQKRERAPPGGHPHGGQG